MELLSDIYPDPCYKPKPLAHGEWVRETNSDRLWLVTRPVGKSGVFQLVSPSGVAYNEYPEAEFPKKAFGNLRGFARVSVEEAIELIRINSIPF